MVAPGLATASPQGLKVLARAEVLDNRAWTPPTLAGTKLYVRDRQTLAAFERGPVFTVFSPRLRVSVARGRCKAPRHGEPCQSRS